MSFFKTDRLWGIFVLCLALSFIWGCAQPVQHGVVSTLPPVDTIETPSAKDTRTSTETPSEIDVAKIDSTITKKTYQGIEGEFLETPLLKDCHFEFDRYDLTSEARRILADNAMILKKIPKSKIQVEGHCDERGTKEYNLALGERRASMVKNYLVSLGIYPNSISTISYGEEMPLDLRSNEDAWAKNRRAHIIILSK